MIDTELDTELDYDEWAAGQPAPHLDWDAYEESMDDFVLMSIKALLGCFEDLEPAGSSSLQIDRIAAMEQLRGALAGAQLAEEVAFADRQRTEQTAAGVRSRDLGRGICEQIGYARRISPVAAAHHLGLGQALIGRLPEAFGKLRTGQVSEAQCQILSTRTSHLSDVDAMIVDAAIAPRMAGWNISATEQAVNQAAYHIDPRAFVDRRGKAEHDRRVWVRPAPDCMSIVSALLPAAQGVAVYASLRKAAETGRGTGDRRGLGQIMADTVVERVTGQSQAHLVPVQVNLTISSETLLGGHQPGWLQDYGQLPAEHARTIAAGDPPGCHRCLGEHSPSLAHCPGPADQRAGDPLNPRKNAEPAAAFSNPDGCPEELLDTDGADSALGPDLDRARAWIMRVLTDPITGVATNMDSRRRIFDGNARRFITVRDRACREPYCSSPIRHADHITPHRRGGRTSIDNGQGLCERGNYVKDMPGWTTSRGERPGEIITTTPTGHRYRTLPPPQTGLPTCTVRL